jgi:hypothetical protein
VAPNEAISGVEDEYLLSKELPLLLDVREPAPNGSLKAPERAK